LERGLRHPRQGVHDAHDVRPPLSWPRSVLPFVEGGEACDVGTGRALDCEALRSRDVLVPEGHELYVFDLVRALRPNEVLEDIEAVVVIEDAELVPGLDEAD